MDGSVTTALGSLGFDTAEAVPNSNSKNTASSTKDTSPSSQALASESQGSSNYKYLALQVRHESNNSASQSQSRQKPEVFVPLIQRTVIAKARNPYTGKSINYAYAEYEATGAMPVVGFVRQPAPENIELPASKPDEPEEPWKVFPPPANSVYSGLGRKAEEEYDPQQFDNFDAALDGAGLAIRNTPSPEKKISVQVTPTGGKTSTGDMVATGINFTRKAWVDLEPSAVGEIYNGDEQKADFIRNLDEGAQIEYCKKCKETHIPPGSPLTLPERDTCGAYLPDWYPSEGVVKPWSNFMEMVKHWILLSEIEQGYNHKENPERPIWSLEFHDHHEKWKQNGRPRGRGGWWKCRTGPDGTWAERSCRVCTSQDAMERENEARLKRGHVTTVAQCKANIENWVEEMVKEGGRRDKEAALAMWRANGIPQHYGPPISRNGIHPVTEGTRPVTGVGVSARGPRTLLTPEQMFSEKLFKGNGHQPSAPKTMEKDVKNVGLDSGLGSSTRSNTSPVTGQLVSPLVPLPRVRFVLGS